MKKSTLDNVMESIIFFSQNALYYLPSIISFILMLAALVIAHELGHYLAAKRCGMKVEEFAVGIGQPSFTVAERDGTKFTVRAWPLGGFVKISGSEPMEDGSEVNIEKGFYSKSPSARLFVLFAGPLFSILFGFLIITGYYYSQGIDKPTNKPIIGSLYQDGAAVKAGLEIGDKIVSINNVKVNTFFDIIQVARENAEKELNLTIERDGKLIQSTITPIKDTSPTSVLSPNLMPTEELKVQGKIGAICNIQKESISVLEATSIAGRITIGTGYAFIKIFTSFTKAKENLGGIGTIAAVTHKATQQGIAAMINFSGMLSLSLGYFNLLPIFPLDGGQMVVAFTELLRGGKRLSFKMQNYIATAGFALILMILAGSLWNDYSRIASGMFNR